jgi:hypothetical protein
MRREHDYVIFPRILVMFLKTEIGNKKKAKFELLAIEMFHLGISYRMNELTVH